VKILALTNLYPPHHAGTFDLRCQNVVQGLRLRGHQILVLTSSHGMRSEQRDGEVERRLRLNNAFGHPLVSKYLELKALELHNHAALGDVITRYQPDVIQVFSLNGLSKSLIYGLRNSKVPTVYDVADDWICEGIAKDPWLRYWNSPSLPFLDQSARTALELSGERGRLDSTAPTRMARGYDRLPILYAREKPDETPPNSVPSMRFDRLFFCSQFLKEQTGRAGFCIEHGEVIYPGVQTQEFIGEIRPASAPINRFIAVGDVTEKSGFMTAIQAVKVARDHGAKLRLSIYGKGDTRYMADVRSLIVRHSLPVEFLPVSNLVKDLPMVYRNHDAFLHCSEWPEPFPIAPLQAMAAGLPVIATTSGGGSELFRHGENAFTYTPGDAVDLASRIQELQIQPALRTQAAETAQVEVLSKYNESVAMDQVENYLNTSQEIWAHTAT
jgi:glycogen(starch) synthase